MSNLKRIGGHVSTAGGFDKALDRAKEINANCAQIFASSPRVWKSAWEQKLDRAQFLKKKQELDVQPVFTHALYLVNLASDKPASVQKSIAALTSELHFDAALGGGGVVVHVGSHQGRGWEASKDQVAQAISDILAETPDESTFLIENSAGQKGKVCSDLNEIRWLLDQINSPRLGWCFDTCHSFAAGYYLGANSPEEGTGQGSAIQTITELNLWDTLKCIHVNDSKGGFDTGLDRHENIGDGQIGKVDLQHFLQNDHVKPIPVILEVPGLEGNGPDAENIKRLRALAE